MRPRRISLLRARNRRSRAPQIAGALGIAKSTAGKFISQARAAGVDWATAQSLSDEELEARVFAPPVARASRHLEPDYALIHQELKRPGVTLQLLWEEYRRANAQAYKYTSFCVKYRAWAAGLKRSMRQHHPAGERAFVDYAGQRVPIVDADTGQISRAQIFVAVLGASNYTYACATLTQSAPDWVASLIASLEFFGGVPGLAVRSNWAMPAIILTSVWKDTGFIIVLFLASLQGIPQEYYEAAALDGANPWANLRYITLPLLSPTIFFALIISFDQFLPGL